MSSLYRVSKRSLYRVSREKFIQGVQGEVYTGCPWKKFIQGVQGEVYIGCPWKKFIQGVPGRSLYRVSREQFIQSVQGEFYKGCLKRSLYRVFLERYTGCPLSRKKFIQSVKEAKRMETMGIFISGTKLNFGFWGSRGV